MCISQNNCHAGESSINWCEIGIYSQCTICCHVRMSSLPQLLSLHLNEGMFQEDGAGREVIAHFRLSEPLQLTDRQYYAHLLAWSHGNFKLKTGGNATIQIESSVVLHQSWQQAFHGTLAIAAQKGKELHLSMPWVPLEPLNMYILSITLKALEADAQEVLRKWEETRY